jgi:hypothetical protein
MSEDIVKYYSIHNLLNIKITTKKKLLSNSILNNPLSYFEVKDSVDPDIEIKTGRYELIEKENFLVDHKYHINSDYLYFKDKGKSAEWNAEIKGLEKSPVYINFDGKISGFYKYLVPDILCYETLLKPFMELMLGLKGYFLAHAGGLSKNGEAVLFFGMAGSLKSTIILNGVKKGYNTLGDDKVILDINSKKVYSFPVYHQLFDYTVDLGKEELTVFQKFKFLFFSNDKTDSKWDNSPNQFKKAFILKRIDKVKPSINKIDNESAINSMITNNKDELYNSSFSSVVGKNNFYNYLLAFSYIFPDSKISNYWNKLKVDLKETFKNTEFYEIEIPQNYDQSTIGEIFKLIGDDC